MKDACGSREAPPLALIVDDEEPNRLFFEEILEQFSMTSRSLADGSAATREILETRPFLVLCDIRMPGKSGIEIWGEVAREDPDLAARFVFVTGDATEEKTRAFLRESGALHVGKPFTLAEFRRALEAFFARRAPGGAARKPEAPGSEGKKRETL
jgi:CheY-like chemotaxis protein